MRPPRWLVLGALTLGAALPACFTLDVDGDGDIDVPPPAGYEIGFVACANGRDDDQDGRIDCQDADCLRGGHCGEQLPIEDPLGYENTFESCSNGRDDDDDGQFDCGDRGCQDILELCCNLEFDDASCSNLIDDDGNGFADCRDFSCRNNPFVTVCDEETDCSDGFDNDGDRRADCLDRDCISDPACDESGEQCGNGEDDDGDELIDCLDPGCAGSSACPPEARCDDDVDDNGDGRTDCADPSCWEDAACLGPEDTLARCQDGFDNDGNTFTDCDDFSCSRSMNMAIVAYCESIAENTVARCSDGVDNDGNGFADCADFSCSRADDPAIRSFCASLEETTLEQCSNGEDDDQDGFTDCNDFSCSDSDDVEVVRFCRTQVEQGFEVCADGRDNDGNGFTDCGDFSCSRLFAISHGARFCDVDDDCPGARRCNSSVAGAPRENGLGADYCEIIACPGGDGSQCPPETECVEVQDFGGVLDLCMEACVTDDDCAPGLTCYPSPQTTEGLCLALASPCAETPTVDADTEVIANDGTSIDDYFEDITTGQRQRIAYRQCSDARDPDGDGFTDCEDWECNHNPLAVDPATGGPVCRFAGGRTCVLGPDAGRPCGADADCAGGVSGACSRPGPAGQEFVCP